MKHSRNARVRRYTAREVAQATGLNVETVRRAVRSGELPCVRSPSGHFWVVLGGELEAWLERRAWKNAGA